MSRTTSEVFEDHLRLRSAGDLETDLQRNYAPDVVLLTKNSNAEGHEAMRISAARLSEQLPDGRFDYIAKQVNGPYALLIWQASSPRCDVIAGADSFLIRDGLIRMQTIHYQLVPHQGG